MIGARKTAQPCDRGGPSYEDDWGDRMSGLDNTATPIKIDGWGHPRESPAKAWAKLLPHNTYVTRHRHWLDHLYRLKWKDGVVFVAEPYDLREQDLQDLAALVKDGWHVEVRTDMATHFPGRTVWVGIGRSPWRYEWCSA